MTPITHHLDDSFLMAHSAGTLPEAFALVVAAHVSLCDDCRARLEAFDALGGALLDAPGAAPLPPVADESLSACLARIAAGPAEPAAARRAPRGAVFPAPLQDYVGGDLDHARWRRVGGGVRQMLLGTGPGPKARLLRIPAGAAVPDHGHGGSELTLVLKGAFRDGPERFGRGDVEIAGEDTVHTPVAEDGEDCICLAATDAPLRFRGLLPRLAQTIMRI